MAQDTQCGSADVFKVALFGCNVLQMSAPQPAQSKESKGKGEEEVARKRLFRGTRLCSFTAIGAGHLEPSCLHLPAFPQNRSSFSTYMPVPIQYDFLIFHSLSCKHQAIWLGFFGGYSCIYDYIDFWEVCFALQRIWYWPCDGRAQMLSGKFFLAGCCSRGDACNFAHSTDDLQDLPDFSKTRLCDPFMRSCLVWIFSQRVSRSLCAWSRRSIKHMGLETKGRLVKF